MYLPTYICQMICSFQEKSSLSSLFYRQAVLWQQVLPFFYSESRNGTAVLQLPGQHSGPVRWAAEENIWTIIAVTILHFIQVDFFYLFRIGNKHPPQKFLSSFLKALGWFVSQRVTTLNFVNAPFFLQNVVSPKPLSKYQHPPKNLNGLLSFSTYSSLKCRFLN